MRFWLFFTFLALSFPAMAKHQCLELFNAYKTVQGTKEYLVKVGHRFAYNDTTYGFKFEAELDNDGILAIDIQLIDQKLGLRSYQHGSQLYAQMIQHFGLEKIKGITGVWGEGTNFDKFYANLRNRMSVEDAALNTWSGRQAALYGFTKIASYEFTKVEESEFGDIPYPIHRRPFSVLFTRP